MANTQVYVGETGAKELYRKVKAKIEDLGTAVEGELGLKADKTELESAVDTINESLSDINTELATKADESDLNDAVSDINDELAVKSDIGHTHVKTDITDFDHNHDDRYYTETEIDGFLGNKEDISNKITAFDNQPTDAQYPSALLVKNEIARLKQIIADLGGFEVVTTLDHGHPNPEKPSHKIIYLYKDPDGPEQDPYTEWIYTVDEEWDVIGTTYVDLTQYYTSDAVDTLLATKVDKVPGKELSSNDFTDAFKTKLTDLPTNAELGTLLDAKADDATTLAGYGITDAYTKTEVDNSLDGKVDKVTGKGLSSNDYTDADVAIVHKVWVSDDYTLIVDPTKVEIGGRTYDVVRIGNQMWTTKNLDWKFDGLTVGGDYGVTVPAAWYPDNNETTYGWKGAGYGLLYNYYAAVYLRDNNMLSNGWRVPTSNDWSTLVATVSTTGTGSTTNNAGLKLKAKSVGGTDDYNFSMLLPGIRQGNGVWVGIGSYVGNLALTDHGVVYENSNSSSNYLSGTQGDTKSGYSLRLVKDVT